MSEYRQVDSAVQPVKVLMAGFAVAVIGLLAACGGGDQDPAPAAGASAGDGGVASAGGGGVASIGGGAEPGATPSSSAERPLIRPDTSPEEEERLYAVYWQCFEDKGVSELARRMEERTPRVQQATKECAPLEPEATWERAMRLDPEYPDKLRAWASCLQDRGVDAFVDGDFLSLADGLPSGNEIRECEAEVFTAG
ncbi:hypothetical protein [Micromonospora sp. NBC_01813]|uniref:hypothetical protein n=1 Tax=Micromonospora sp. NBC_01813 TaxID=2975988 RepID=UPI002DD933B5|nr:hypothetical protein [Micromonospora sp. NBC_01813]WSA06692.1 hypothetical protein OG958_20645 [Micromonospora sp. NBC_01813]